MGTMSDSIYQRVTDLIIGHLATADPASWVCPWLRSSGGLPVNALTARSYRGVNVLTFWASASSAGYRDNRWASFRQWGELGAQVRKGEKGTPCIFYKPLDSRAGHDASAARSNDQSEAADTHFVLRFSTVFNADQVAGAPPSPQIGPTPAASEAETAIDRLAATAGATIIEGRQPSYVPLLDVIRMPCRGAFLSTEGHTGTLAHELIHWSGAKHRLDRQLQNRFASRAYAAEELIAELGAAFLLAKLKLASVPHPDHANYIASWISLLRDDPRAIFTAAAHASRAADYLAQDR